MGNKTANKYSRRIRVPVFLGVVFLFIMVFFIFSTLNGVEIKRSNFHGLRIGDSKIKVLDTLAHSKVSFITPEVENNISVVAGDNLRIYELAKYDGICITDNKGRTAQISFDQEGILHIVYESVPKILGFDDVKTKDDFFALTFENAGVLRGFTISNCIPGVKSISLQGISLNNISYLKRYDVWGYYVPDSYSSVKLKFTEGRLNEILLRIQPYEAP